jgi:predicted transcriptional regulator
MALSPSGDVAALESQFADIAKTQRKRIWDLPGHYHCSIVGTCLSTAELKKLLSTLGMAAPAESEHDLHGLGVGLASRQDMAGKLLNKALDDRHLLTLKRYARARTLEALQALWREDVKSGDIPGGYWAVLTHPACAHALAREAFGYVHMLSHLVGAANRADIRRLQQLEAQNALLAETIERQQVKLRDIAVECRATVQQWQRDLAGREMADESPAVDAQASLRSMIADLRRQLDSETNRRTIAEARLSRAQAEISEARVAATQAQNLAKTLQSEIDAVERGLASRQAEGLEDTPEPAIDLGGMTVLYVGGRPTQLPHLRQAAAARGAAFLHHDGGIEDNGLMLAGLVNRADLVLFPVDCVSHAAVGTVKRACRNAGKTYLPLRSAAVTSFIAALGGQP